MKRPVNSPISAWAYCSSLASARETLGQSCFRRIGHIVVARFSSTFAGNRVARDLAGSLRTFEEPGFVALVVTFPTKELHEDSGFFHKLVKGSLACARFS